MFATRDTTWIYTENKALASDQKLWQSVNRLALSGKAIPGQCANFDRTKEDKLCRLQPNGIKC